jgi:large subunit ribosomal protein L19
MSKIIEKINKEQLKANRDGFGIGDTVCVHTIVKEGDKERVQKFTGVVIGRRGTDINAFSRCIRRALIKWWSKARAASVAPS